MKVLKSNKVDFEKRFSGSHLEYLTAENSSFNQGTTNICVVYSLSDWKYKSFFFGYPNIFYCFSIIYNCVFGAVELAKNVDPN